MFENKYQTVPLPNGKVFKGMFPTIEWYNEMKKFVDFKDKRVMDYGCCTFSYGISALNDGALWVIGYDNEERKVRDSELAINSWGYGFGLNPKAGVALADIEVAAVKYCDVAILSMIIHWLKKPEETVKHIALRSEEVIIVFRYPQDFEEPGFYPTLEELDELLKESHIRMGNTKLSSTKEQNIMLVIYGRNI